MTYAEPHLRPGRLGWVAVYGLLVSSGCVGAMGEVTDPFARGGSGGASEAVRIEVQNLNFNDVTVFALRSGQQVRLGRVTGKSDQAFTISWNFAIPISFRVDIVGGQSCRTPSIGVDPGSRVWVQIPSDAGLSNCRSGRR